MKISKMETQLEQQTSSNLETENNKNYLTEFKEVKDTPFTLVKREDVWVIAMGDKIVSDKQFKTSIEGIKYINTKPYSLIIVATAVYIDKINEIKNNVNGKKENE